MVDRNSEWSGRIVDIMQCFNLVIEILMVDRRTGNSVQVAISALCETFQSRNRDSYG